MRAMLLLCVCALLAGCAQPNIATVERFRASRERGDLDGARAMMAPDARVWYDKKEGPGEPWTIGGGNWHDWDTHFHGTSEPTGWRTDDRGASVWSPVVESNDYYRLTERGSQTHRETYFFAASGRMSGFMVSPEPDAPNPPGREKEFIAWAKANHPEEWAYLRPGGRIDPSGDRAPRTRTLLMEWRRAIGQAGSGTPQ